MCQTKYLFISTIIHATAENNQLCEKNREEQIQRLCICIKEIKRKGKLPSLVSDAGGKVDTKPLQLHKCNSENRHCADTWSSEATNKVKLSLHK